MGFGGEIRVDDAVVRDSRCYAGFYARPVEIREEKSAGKFELWNCACADHTERAKGLVELNEVGTRHRSAFRLCAALPGTLAFVVSQDRTLSVFYGEDHEHVWLWRRLEASPRRVEQS